MIFPPDGVNLIAFPTRLEIVCWIRSLSANTQFGPGAGGSKQAVGAGGAVTVTAQALRKKVLAIAAKMLEAAPEDLTLEQGKVFVKDDAWWADNLEKTAVRFKEWQLQS